MIAPRRAAVTGVSLLARASGLNAALRLRRHRRGDYRVYILEYHDVASGEEKEGTVDTERFRRHLRYLTPRFRCTTVEQAADRLERAAATGTSLGEDLLVLTFDDGYLDNYRSAWPALRQAGVPATIYLTTGFLDGEPLWFDLGRRAFAASRRRSQPLPHPTFSLLHDALGGLPKPGTEIDHLKRVAPEIRRRIVDSLLAEAPDLPPGARPLGWEQVREMMADGIEMGAHTVSHPILSTISAEEQRAEMNSSRQRIAEKTGREPTTFAMPNGAAEDWNATTLRLLAEGGFRAACTTLRGSNRPGDDLFRLRRLGIGCDSNTVIDARLAGVFDQGLRQALRRSGQIVGPSAG